MFITLTTCVTFEKSPGSQFLHFWYLGDTADYQKIYLEVFQGSEGLGSEESGCWAWLRHCGHEHSHDGGVKVKSDGTRHFGRGRIVKQLFSGCASLESLQFI